MKQIFEKAKWDTTEKFCDMILCHANKEGQDLDMVEQHNDSIEEIAIQVDKKIQDLVVKSSSMVFRIVELEILLNESLKFIAYAYDQGISGAETLGKEIEELLKNPENE